MQAILCNIPKTEGRGGNQLTEARRTYHEGCVAAHALDLIGDRWALLVVRELMLGPKRFGVIRAGLPGIATNMLARRLNDLEAGGIVTQQAGYALTEAGLALRPVLDALCRWGGGMPGHDPRRFISPSALMLSMQANLDADAAQGAEIATFFDMGTECFAGHVTRGAWHVKPAAFAPEGALILTGSANQIAPVIYGPVPAADAAALFGVTISGQTASLQPFADLFALRRMPDAAAQMLAGA